MKLTIIYLTSLIVLVSCSNNSEVFYRSGNLKSRIVNNYDTLQVFSYHDMQSSVIQSAQTILGDTIIEISYFSENGDTVFYSKNRKSDAQLQRSADMKRLIHEPRFNGKILGLYSGVKEFPHSFDIFFDRIIPANGFEFVLDTSISTENTKFIIFEMNFEIYNDSTFSIDGTHSYFMSPI